MSRKKLKDIKRRYATKYYSDSRAHEGAFSSQGAASSEQGAIRATVVKVFMHDYAKALIFDRVTGVLLYTVRITAQGIQAYYGQSGDSAQLRRVK